MADKGTGSEIAVLASVYGSLAADVPEALARLEEGLTEQPNADPEYKIAKQQVNVAVALLVMGRGEKVWSLLKHGPDPTLRSLLIERPRARGCRCLTYCWPGWPGSQTYRSAVLWC